MVLPPSSHEILPAFLEEQECWRERFLESRVWDCARRPRLDPRLGVCVSAFVCSCLWGATSTCWEWGGAGVFPFPPLSCIY